MHQVSPLNLAALPPGDRAVIETLQLEDSDARRLMEFGFIPGALVACSCHSPFGDPAVYQIDGAEVALRRETASRIMIRCNGASLS